MIAAPAMRLRADEFYFVRLKAGEEAYRAHRKAEAVEQLRVACFGLLDQPVLLIEGLVALSLAQTAAGNMAEADATLARFLEVERLFTVYDKARLESGIKAEFEALAARKLSPESLVALPSMARLVETQEQKFAKLNPAERRRAMEARVRAEPSNVELNVALARDAAAQNDSKSVVRWSDAVLAADEKNVEARSLRAHARTQRREYAGALADLLILPASRVEADPLLTADLFLCRVATRDWDSARSISMKLDEQQRLRPEVIAALRKLPRERIAAESNPEKANEGTPEPRPASAVVISPTPAPTGPPPPAPTRAPVILQSAASSATADEVVAAARKLSSAGKPGEALRLLQASAEKIPPTRSLRKALLEAACLNKDWKAAAAQTLKLEPFQEGEEASAFYAAVAAYEMGSLDRARSLLSNARSKIVSSAYVDYYLQRIFSNS